MFILPQLKKKKFASNSISDLPIHCSQVKSCLHVGHLSIHFEDILVLDVGIDQILHYMFVRFCLLTKSKINEN